MSDWIVVVGNEEELLLLAQSLDQRYCGKNGTVKHYTELPNPAPDEIERLFVVGHADITKIGDFAPRELVSHLSQWLPVAKKIYLAGCSTGDANQQVINDGFRPTKPLAEAVKKAAPNASVYFTPGVLVRYDSDGRLELLGSTLSQGATKTDIFVNA